MRQSAVDIAEATVIELPLRRNWCALNTPSERVPSHGTDYFGQRYAFDFCRLRFPDQSPYLSSFSKHLLGLVQVTDCYAWNQPVYACFDGEVVGVGDGWADRKRLNFVWDLLRASFFAEDAKPNDYRPLTGNYVFLAGEVGVALYAHLRCGSITVKLGQKVKAGEVLGHVGHSGNSTMPHLHFQLMTIQDPFQAEGILCAFREYERFQDGVWQRVECGIPELLQPIRFGGEEFNIA